MGREEKKHVFTRDRKTRRGARRQNEKKGTEASGKDCDKSVAGKESLGT